METLGAQRARIAAALGPMISQKNYEVGTDLIEKFAAQDSANERFFAPGARAGHAQFDLPGYIASRLRTAGLTRIEDLAACTYADPARFYSYRRSTHRGEADYGRHINAISLTG
jgi:copper oxidase (laccase) domain-containing protein